MSVVQGKPQNENLEKIVLTNKVYNEINESDMKYGTINSPGNQVEIQIEFYRFFLEIIREKKEI